MYYIYGISGPFLLIESTDSMIKVMDKLTAVCEANNISQMSFALYNIII